VWVPVLGTQVVANVTAVSHLESVGLGDGAARLPVQLQQLAGQHLHLVITTSQLHLFTIQHHRFHLIQLRLQHRLTSLVQQLEKNVEGVYIRATERHLPYGITQ